MKNNKCLLQEEGEQPAGVPEGHKVYYCAKCNVLELKPVGMEYCLRKNLKKSLNRCILLGIFCVFSCLFNIFAACISNNAIFFIIDTGFALWMER